MQPKVGGKLLLKLNTGTRPIANKYREGKVKSTLKRECETVRREANAAELALLKFRNDVDWRCHSAKADRFALGIAVNSSALLCKAGQQQLPVAVGKVVTSRSETYSHPSGSPGATEDNRQCRPLAWAASGRLGTATGTACSVC